MRSSKYNEDVFVNCPFDRKYKKLFYAIIFAVFDCGFRARCSLEIMATSEIRIESISKVISGCKFGIHDISRTQLDSKSNLPRFNMPLELGLFIGAKRFGQRLQKKKCCIVLDSDPYRYQKFISDISGQDISSHNNDQNKAVQIIRNWLRAASSNVKIPGASVMCSRYDTFCSDLPKICKVAQIKVSELTFNDYSTFVSDWLEENP